MQRHRKNKSIKQKYFWLILLIILSQLLWILPDHNNNRYYLKNMVNKILTPSKYISSQIQQWYTHKQKIRCDTNEANIQIEKLKTQLITLITLQHAQMPLIAEADNAIQLLNLKKIVPINMKPAHIIINTHNHIFSGFIIDQGKDANLMPEQGLINTEGIIGRIWSVDNHQAAILPIDAYNSATAVTLSKNQMTSILKGCGNGKAIINYNNNEYINNIEVGEPIFTSGLDQIFPKGLLVGHVSAIKKRDNIITVEVRLAANLDHLWLVFILPMHTKAEIQNISI